MALVRFVWPLDKRSGPLSAEIEGTPHQLWGYIYASPQWPWNLRVMADGTVDQREGLTQDELNEAQVIMWGGHQYDVEEGSWLHGVLQQAGYTFTEIVDGYGEIKYGSPQPEEAEPYGSPVEAQT